MWLTRQHYVRVLTYIFQATITITCTSNFFLQAGHHVDDLYTDLGDGRLLIRLLETLSGEKIGSIGRGRLRINKIENVGKAIHFLQQKKVK